MKKELAKILFLTIVFFVMLYGTVQAEWLATLKADVYRNGKKIASRGDIVDHRPDNGRRFAGSDLEKFNIIHVDGKTWDEIRSVLQESGTSKYAHHGRTTLTAEQIKLAIQAQQIP